ncbi:hypothetical protein ACQ4M3_00615 [Leptolyngbya sp. AN03gr2]|uniref:hypothetical protein n=1 Tax=unclassified Leptolyngbya TaxID=2650499 RepID=UPI003D31798E
MIYLEKRNPFLLIGLFAAAIVDLLAPQPAYSIPRQCIPIAYVLSDGDRNFKRGSLLCQGDTIQRSLTVLCFATGKIVALGSGKIPPTGCGLPKETGPQACGTRFQFCVRPRGTNAANLQILQPYGSNTTKLRPRFSWRSVPGATSYRVRVLGTVSWSIATTQSQLAYPENQPAFKPGGAYRIVITAHRENQTLLSGEQTINVLPQSRISEINRAIAALQQLNLDPDEATVLGIDSIYRANGLIDESIGALAARVKAGSRSAQVYRLLSERYRLVGEDEMAKQLDQAAQRLTVSESLDSQQSADQAAPTSTNALQK